MRKIINSLKAPNPVGPYSQAVVVNNILYTSGQIGIDPQINKLVSDDIGTQTRQVMENLKAILTEAGTAFHNVIKSTIYVTDLSNFKVVNDIYGSYFNENPPARETSQAVQLPVNAKVEISMVALCNLE